VRLRFIGQRHRFSERLQRLMTHAEAVTANNDARYGGDCRRLRRPVGHQPRRPRARRALQHGDLDPASHRRRIPAAAPSWRSGEFPPPDLCIRTGGDARISNFLLWDFAYTELYFTPVLWPDFGELEFARALADYGRRERRFGGSGARRHRSRRKSGCLNSA
jgi:undecaprenyl diphosphate synthase